VLHHTDANLHCEQLRLRKQKIGERRSEAATARGGSIAQPHHNWKEEKRICSRVLQGFVGGETWQEICLEHRQREMRRYSVLFIIVGDEEGESVRFLAEGKRPRQDEEGAHHKQLRKRRGEYQLYKKMG
jgi:hypothetical protein